MENHHHHHHHQDNILASDENQKEDQKRRVTMCKKGFKMHVTEYRVDHFRFQNQEPSAFCEPPGMLCKTEGSWF
jgi:hypothetical protein